jgi:GNAT superfamily N-acetyltransferase
MNPRIEEFRPEQDLDGLAQLLHATVHAGASVNFILPFPMDHALTFWREKVLPGASEGTRRVLVARCGERVVGSVQLNLGMPPNQRHRAEVMKLLVHPDARRRGIGRALMEAIENIARQEGRTLLTLDTRTGDAAEPLYLSMGYVLVGVIPRFSRDVASDELQAASILYKEIGR